MIERIINTEVSENVRQGRTPHKRERYEHGTDTGELKLVLGS